MRMQRLAGTLPAYRAIPLSLLLVLGWSLVTEAVPVAVTNSSFELPGTVKTKFFDGAGNPAPNVPGWTASAVGVEPGPGDSGVESSASFGLWAGYLSGLDPSIYQTTSYLLQAGDRAKLTFGLDDSYTSDTNYTQILNQAFLKATLYYFDGTNRVPLGSTTFGPFGYGYADRVVDVSSIPGAALGKPIGIDFDNVGDLMGPGVVHSWIHLDNVRLDVVPEPGAIALLTLGGLGLAMPRRWRR